MLRPGLISVRTPAIALKPWSPRVVVTSSTVALSNAYGV